MENIKGIILSNGIMAIGRVNNDGDYEKVVMISIVRDDINKNNINNKNNQNKIPLTVDLAPLGLPGINNVNNKVFKHAVVGEFECPPSLIDIYMRFTSGITIATTIPKNNNVTKFNK